ncbi:hypothetical protein KAR91_33175 [Candidatus Pacearchaeota archaeon]|nr:hypothetical protein [Candidatus Pacearchaeota archaeon]
MITTKEKSNKNNKGTYVGHEVRWGSNKMGLRLIVSKYKEFAEVKVIKGDGRTYDFTEYWSKKVYDLVNLPAKKAEAIGIMKSVAADLGLKEAL